MSDDMRREYIEWLLIWTNWNRAALEAMEPQKLLREYERHRRIV